MKKFNERDVYNLKQKISDEMHIEKCVINNLAKDFLNKEEFEKQKMLNLFTYILSFGDEQEFLNFKSKYDISKIDNFMSFIYQSERTDLLKLVDNSILNFNINFGEVGRYENIIKLNSFNYILSDLYTFELNWLVYGFFNEHEEIQKNNDMFELKKDIDDALKRENINLQTTIKSKMFFGFEKDVKLLDLILMTAKNEDKLKNNFLIQKYLDNLQLSDYEKIETLITLCYLEYFDKNTIITDKIIEKLELDKLDLNKIVNFGNFQISPIMFVFFIENNYEFINKSIDKINPKDIEYIWNFILSENLNFNNNVVNLFNKTNFNLQEEILNYCVENKIDINSEFKTDAKINKKNIIFLLEEKILLSKEDLAKYYNFIDDEYKDLLNDFFKNVDFKNYDSKLKIFLSLLEDENLIENKKTNKRKM